VRLVLVAIGLLAVAFAACYSAPDYTGTRFQCGPERGCPADQDCVNGFCEAAGSFVEWHRRHAEPTARAMRQRDVQSGSGVLRRQPARDLDVRDHDRRV